MISDPVDGLGHDAVDEVLEAQPTIGKGHVAEIDDVDRTSTGDEMRDQALVSAQVEAADMDGQRRDQQDRVAVRVGRRITPQHGVRLVVHDLERGRIGRLHAVAEVVRAGVADPTHGTP